MFVGQNMVGTQIGGYLRISFCFVLSVRFSFVLVRFGIIFSLSSLRFMSQGARDEAAGRQAMLRATNGSQ